MIINWLDTKVDIHQGGHYQWPKGVRRNPFWSRWVFDHQLRLCLGGHGWISLQADRTPLERGSCQWLRAGWEYDVVADPKHPLEFLTIRFDLLDATGQSRSNVSGLPPEDLHGLDLDYMEAEMRRIVDDLASHRTHGDAFTRKFGSSFSGIRRMRATARFTALLMEIDERTYSEVGLGSRVTHPRVLKLLEIARGLSSQPGRAPSVEELARRAEYTREHFCRAFKRVTGHTPQEFLIVWRLRHARRLLLETSLPIKAIAAELGYQNSDFFTRQFHNRTGMTPTAFREANPPLI